MQKNLYFICPTDCIETVINNTFKTENYFYASLGNSFNANSNILERIKCVVKKNDIQNICFVLSSNNKIIQDAMLHQDYSYIHGLQRLYSDIESQQKNTYIISKENTYQFVMFSCFLHKKVQELQRYFIDFPIKISAKIYDIDRNIFTPISSNLVCLKKHQLN